jgi:hypothetical protein
MMIDDNLVRAALEHMRQGRALDGERQAAVVALCGRPAAAPGARGADELALYDLLCDRIERSWLELRGRTGLPDHLSPAEAASPATLAEDFRAGNRPLESWTCLYHRYALPRPMQVQQMARIARPGSPHGRRLVHRRLRYGVHLLAEQLRSLDGTRSN